MKTLIIHQMPWIKRPLACKAGMHQFKKADNWEAMELQYIKKLGIICEECANCGTRKYEDPSLALTYINYIYTKPEYDDADYQKALDSAFEADSNEFIEKLNAYEEAVKEEKKAHANVLICRRAITPAPRSPKRRDRG